ncbi:MAG: capsular exopolysaccharide synthesis family protein [Planctomycetota bacterium]|jgi:capsular exopolysaccharide synthesis family protein
MSDNQYSESAGGVSLEQVFGLVRRRKLTVLFTAALIFFLTFVWVGTQTPVYRSSATVLIDPDNGDNGLFSELASLGKAPPAASEIAIIRSRSIAEKVVATPPNSTLAHPGIEGFDRHLGLTTSVEDESMRPLATLFRRLFGGPTTGGELFAAVTRVEADSPQSIRVNFPIEGRVRFSKPGFLSSFGYKSEAVTLNYQPGEIYNYRGLEISLHTEGIVRGRNFVITTKDRAGATRQLVQSTRIIETERNSGVVMITVNDSDPRRAARITDAICLNYFDLNLSRGGKRASQTVSFIDAQLDEQQIFLKTAEKEVAGMQTEHPETINVSSAAQSLIERLSELEVERVHMSITHSALGEALELLDSNKLTALALLGTEIADPITLSYIEQISLLTAEFEMQDRTDTGPYKLLKQQQLEALRTQSNDLDSQAASLEFIIEAYALGDNSVLAGLTGDPVDGFGGGPLVAGYLTRISELEAEQTELAQRYKADYPRLVNIASTIEGLKSHVLKHLGGRLDALTQMRTDREQLLESTLAAINEHPGQEREQIQIALDNLRNRTILHMRARYDAVKSRQSALEEQIVIVEQRLGELPERERQLAGPLRRLEAHAEIVKLLLKNQQEAEITRAATVSTAEFIDPAEVPILRYAPRVSFTLVLGSILGILGGLGVAYSRERFKGSIHTEAELESVSGLPVLGAIPDFRAALKNHRGLDAFLALRDDPDGPVAEAYRSLRANLRFSLGGEKEIRTLAVTSCTPGEGKSVTNADLAIAFASGNKRVLLVDADLRKPRVHKNFPVNRSPGIADVMLDDENWRDAVQLSGIENLEILSAGVHRGKPGDIIARPDFSHLVDELSAEYDIVIFDLPPALVVADVENFAHKLDALLLLYRSDGVSRDAIRTASTRLRQTGCNLVGTILNAVRPEHGKAGGYYHSYYEYAEEEKKPRFRKGA